MRRSPIMAHAPIAFITAKESRNIRKLMNHAQNVVQAIVYSGFRLEKLNDWSEPQFAASAAGRRYAAVEDSLCNANWNRSAHDRRESKRSHGDIAHMAAISSQRLRDELPFGEIPIRLIIEDRNPEDPQARRRQAEAKGLDENTRRLPCCGL